MKGGEKVKIHESAYVSPDAEIGEGTSIWNNSQIREEAVIGEGCNIGKDVYVDKGVRIGNRVKIQNGVSVYHGVTVEDDVFLGPHMTFTNDLHPRAFSEDWKVYPTLVKKGASIGANATIVCNTTLGEYSMVGAGAVVTKDVPPHALVVGNPARIVGFVCRCGIKAQKKEEEEDKIVMECPECKETFEVKKEDYEKMRK
ncbi:N-acetyltransferase [Candidatus Woesearchaeota archaeon]|nr:MAG: N-acetyltransferase [Candidatus Woesearchaeota archaeon]